MASIARRNLFEDIPRFLVAQAGIMFAVSLVTIQLGVLRGFSRSTAIVIDYSKADLWVASKDMVYFELTSPLPAEYLSQADKVPGVDRAEALMLRAARWRTPQGKLSPVRIFGFNPDGQLFAGWKLIQGNLSSLKTPYTVLMDRDSLRSLDIDNPNSAGTIGFLPAKVGGLIDDIQSSASSPFVFTSLETANAYGNAEMTSAITCTRQPDGTLDCLNKFSDRQMSQPVPNPPPPPPLNLGDPITYILIRAKPGETLDTLKQRLTQALPKTEVYTRAEMAQLTRRYWDERTGVGFILGLGASVGFVVGMVVVGQILYSSVADHIREFGTLKAMGASNWIIYGVIIEQALWMAVLGYVPSILLCMGLGYWTQMAKGVMILIQPSTAAGVLVLTVLMCVGSALFAVQKVMRVDPAIVFKA